MKTILLSILLFGAASHAQQVVNTSLKVVCPNPTDTSKTVTYHALGASFEDAGLKLHMMYAYINGALVSQKKYVLADTKNCKIKPNMFLRGKAREF